MANSEMKLIMEGWRVFLNEQEKEADLDAFSQELMKALNANQEAIKQTAVAAMRKKAGGELPDQKKELEEILDPVSLSLLGAGIVASMPAILKVISKIAEKTGKLDTAKKFEEWHKKWHHSWLKVIGDFLNVVTLGKFKKLDKQKQEQIEELFFICIVAYLLPHAIQGASHFLHATTLGAKFVAAVEGVLSAIKSGELLSYITKNIGVILGISLVAAVGAAVGKETEDSMKKVNMTGALAAAQIVQKLPQKEANKVKAYEKELKAKGLPENEVSNKVAKRAYAFLQKVQGK